jgi:hypothetical protein
MLSRRWSLWAVSHILRSDKVTSSSALLEGWNECTHDEIKTLLVAFLVYDKSKTTRVWFLSGQNTLVMVFVHSCSVHSEITLGWFYVYTAIRGQHARVKIPTSSFFGKSTVTTAMKRSVSRSSFIGHYNNGLLTSNAPGYWCIDYSSAQK